ncbi:MAG: signal peptide peptidase SppA [Chitinophagales bacterium]|nr:signal peptide peptidase SppA [Chitinophagales bacterium]
MKSFLKYVFATVIGLFIFLILLFGILTSLGGKSNETKISANSVLKVNLVGNLPDVSVEDPMQLIDPLSGNFNTDPILGLKDLKLILKAAANDDKIKAIWLNTDQLSAMPSNYMELLRSLKEFKKSDKLIYAYSNSMSEWSVLLNSVADKSYLNPMANVEFNGFSSEVMYYTGLFEKLKIHPMIFYAGEFKSATEPYRLKAMSPENRLQIDTYLNSIYNNYLRELSANIGISKDSLRMIADGLDIFLADDAYKYKLVDGLKYEDEVENELKEKFGYAEKDKLNLVSLKKYKASIDLSKEEKAGKSKNKIAVIYAEGVINDGDNESGDIYGDTYVKMIRKAASDSDVKALVLRVNSPGGSAFASEQILREIQLTQKKIPVVVSMGNLAASGGYYISSSANKIVADATTITGSIGVFGMMFNIDEALQSNLGITFDRVKTNPYADFGSATRPWDDKEKETITASIKKTYQTFLQHVADGRKMSVEDVDKIARGRVWTGEDAQKLGLVDTLGNIQVAIDIAKNLADIDTYELKNYPESKSAIDIILEKITGSKEENLEQVLEKQLGESYFYLKQIKALQEMCGVQARMPYEVRIK